MKNREDSSGEIKSDGKKDEGQKPNRQELTDSVATEIQKPEILEHKTSENV